VLRSASRICHPESDKDERQKKKDTSKEKETLDDLNLGISKSQRISLVSNRAPPLETTHVGDLPQSAHKTARYRQKVPRYSLANNRQQATVTSILVSAEALGIRSSGFRAARGPAKAQKPAMTQALLLQRRRQPIAAVGAPKKRDARMESSQRKNRLGKDARLTFIRCRVVKKPERLPRADGNE